MDPDAGGTPVITGPFTEETQLGSPVNAYVLPPVGVGDDGPVPTLKALVSVEMSVARSVEGPVVELEELEDC